MREFIVVEFRSWLYLSTLACFSVVVGGARKLSGVPCGKNNVLASFFGFTPEFSKSENSNRNQLNRNCYTQAPTRTYL